MKNAKKALILVLCAALLVGASVMGTLAFLQYQTGTVENTFTVGNVKISLKEYKVDASGKITSELMDATEQDATLNNVKLIPGRVIEKRPFITVAEGSEACYLFVKIENGLDDKITINWAENGKWVYLDNNVWMYKEMIQNTNPVYVFESITCSNAITNATNFSDAKIDVSAYAIQAEGFSDTDGNGTAADEAWEAASTQFTNP